MTWQFDWQKMTDWWLTDILTSFWLTEVNILTLFWLINWHFDLTFTDRQTFWPHFDWSTNFLTSFLLIDKLFDLTLTDIWLTERLKVLKHWLIIDSKIYKKPLQLDWPTDLTTGSVNDLSPKYEITDKPTNHWPTDWQTDWQADWRTAWRTDWQTNQPMNIDWHKNWLDWLTDWLRNWLTDWTTTEHWLTQELTRLIHMTDWLRN